ncbi:TonB-dependent receptor [Rheinheimera sp.]|uniref:TonB-dependent receptor n=1 Tax=Rheinheimera sp. TaxID=1869214 RepID=UPI003AF7B4B6
MNRLYNKVGLAWGLVAASLWLPVKADPTGQMDYAIEQISVYGRKQNLLGLSSSASQGLVSAEEIALRPLSRTGEIMEFVPGMIVTQHSGSGKANQYFLRGFNLDHGTDFATYVDGMPVNMRSHGHGQGYTDVNFLIPELVGQISYAKGPYDAGAGDFASSGSARISLADQLAAPQLGLTLGSYGYQRYLATAQQQWQGERLLYAAEFQTYAGPWTDVDEDVHKLNWLTRYLTTVGAGQLSVSLMAYDNQWQSADQIPLRAVQSGLIDRYGSLDTGLGGDSSRYSLSANYQDDDWSASAYLIQSRLRLLSDFTYLLNDPLAGDQFEQLDQRQVWGGQLSRHWHLWLDEVRAELSLGNELRFDDIGKVALNTTNAGVYTGTVRDDAVNELSNGLFSNLEAELNEWLTLRLGLRYDYFSGEVQSDTALNSGRSDDGILSFKGGLSYLLSDNVELYGSVGQGFHSNDIRGATIHVDPLSGEAVSPVDLLVRSEGAEAGLRYYDADWINFSAAFWTLDFDSELLYVGDAGSTEPSRASRRHGLELASYLWLNPRLSLDAEVAWTSARFRQDEAGEGRYVDGSVPWVASAGVTYQPADSGFYASARLRYLGKRILDSAKQHEADATSLVNLSLGYRLTGWDLKLDVLNLLNSYDHDIDYWYSSRLPGEADEGVEDLNYHPVEPRSVRATVSYRY